MISATSSAEGKTPESLLDAPGPRPEPRDHSLLNQLRLSLSNPIEAWPRAIYEQSSYRAPVPGGPLFLMSPSLIRQVLVEQSDRFAQGDLFRRLLRPIWGRGLATSEGDEWRWQRRAVASAFRPAELAQQVPRMRHAAEAALARWAEAPRDTMHDVAAETATIAFDIILDTMFSGDDGFQRSGFRQRVDAFMRQIAPMRLSYILAPDRFHRGRGKVRSTEARALQADVSAMIVRRRQAPRRGDLIDMLIAAIDPETGRAMDDETISDNLLGFILAGHGTSAAALAWAIYLLSRHRPSRERVHSEVEEITRGHPIDADHVEHLVFTRQVVQETLRLYPPAYSLIRVCTATARLGELAVRRGTRVIIPIYALHRHRLWWRNPDSFDPTRFTSNAPQPERYAYLPFGAGPRVCIGSALAMTELVVVLATLVRHADFTLATGHDVRPRADLSLRPEGGLPMRIVPRQDRRRGDQSAPASRI